MAGSIKEKILSLAIQGKLVSQNENDEPASVLLDKIRAEKRAVLGKKYIDSYIYRGDDNCYYEKVGAETKNITEEITKTSIEIPNSWVWCRGSSILLPMQTKKPTDEYFTYIDIDAIDNKAQIIKKIKKILSKNAPSRASRKVQYGDTLFSMVRPYLKNIAFVTEQFAEGIASTGFYVCSPNKQILLPEYLFLLMRSSFIIDSLMKHMHGDNSPSINGIDIENQLFPIPPIKEQVRILSAVERIIYTLKDED